MPNLPVLAPPRPPVQHRAKAASRFGQRARMTASIRITSPGIVSTAVLVSSILLSTAVLVRTVHRARADR